MRAFLIAVMRSQKAATTIEYGLICALVVLAMMTGIQSFGTSAIGMWGNVSSAVNNH